MQAALRPSDARGARDAWLVFALSAALYLALRQHTFYKTDGLTLVHFASTGSWWGSGHHALYLPLLRLVHALLAPFGISVYESALALSALGGACGVAFAHAGFRRLGLERAQALIASALVGTAPALVFFATVVEYHGAYFALAGFAFWCMARCHERPSAVRALALGAACQLGAQVHSSGNLLPGLLLAWFVALGWGSREQRWRRVRLAVLAALAHAALLPLFGALWSGLGGGTSARSQLAFLLEEPGGLADVPRMLAHEALLPFLPLSVACWLAWLRKELRPELVALFLGLLPYAALSLLLGVGRPDFVERGAYWLPLAIPAARSCAAAVPRTGALGLALVALGLAWMAVARHDDPAPARAFARTWSAIQSEREGVLLIAGFEDHAHTLIALPRQPNFELDLVAQLPPQEFARRAAQLDAALDAFASGKRPLYLTAGALAFLRMPGLASGALLLQRLEQRYELREVRAPGAAASAGVLLVRR
jgi:hypothetical protein